MTTARKLQFAIFGNTYQPKKSASAQKILACLAQHRVEVLMEQSFYEFLTVDQQIMVDGVRIFDGDSFEADFAISMGGDGTFLRAAGRVGAKQMPILGVNMGRLGFLADVAPKDVAQGIDALFAGDYSVEERAVIAVSTGAYALNDVAILKRDTASMISIRTTINGEYLTTYQADGVIVSTPTGSTAYSLSNGGPIIVPGTNVFSLTAVAPHSLNVRPIVIPDSAVLELTVSSRSHSFLVATDGCSEKLPEGTTIRISRAPYNVRVVKRTGQQYFATLREKMMWGADTRE